jgi:hypothetical protein
MRRQPIIRTLLRSLISRLPGQATLSVYSAVTHGVFGRKPCRREMRSPRIRVRERYLSPLSGCAERSHEPARSPSARQAESRSGSRLQFRCDPKSGRRCTGCAICALRDRTCTLPCELSRAAHAILECSLRYSLFTRKAPCCSEPFPAQPHPYTSEESSLRPYN